MHTAYEDGQWCSGQWNDEVNQQTEHKSLLQNSGQQWSSEHLSKTESIPPKKFFVHVRFHETHFQCIVFVTVFYFKWQNQRQHYYLFPLLCFHHSVSQRQWQEVKWQCRGKEQWWHTSADSSLSLLYLIIRHTQKICNRSTSAKHTLWVFFITICEI